MKLKHILILIITILALLFALRTCQNNKPSVRIVKNKVLSKGFKTTLKPYSIILPDTEIIKQFIYITNTDTIIQFDTLKMIVMDYFSKYNYKDTIKIDSFGILALNDTISENKILYRGYKYDLTIPEYHYQASGVYVGPGIGLSTEGVRASINAYYLKNRHLFSAGIDNKGEFNINYGYRLSKY